VAALAAAMTNALTSGRPPFKVVEIDLTREDMFVIKARHGISIGYRECLIVAGQVAENETRILFKVIESENPPKANLLGGLLQLPTKVTLANNDPKVARERLEKLEQRIKEGIAIIREKIHGAIEQIPAMKE